jgi:hypothetical protein
MLSRIIDCRPTPISVGRLDLITDATITIIFIDKYIDHEFYIGLFIRLLFHKEFEGDGLGG